MNFPHLRKTSRSVEHRRYVPKAQHTRDRFSFVSNSSWTPQTKAKRSTREIHEWQLKTKQKKANKQKKKTTTFLRKECIFIFSSSDTLNSRAQKMYSLICELQQLCSVGGVWRSCINCQPVSPLRRQISPISQIFIYFNSLFICCI